MIRADDVHASWVGCKTLTLAQLREQPWHLLVSVLAIAIGIALGAGVHFVHSAALEEFDQATRRLVGAASLIVRGPSTGFDESLYVRLARDPGIGAASPVLELQLTLPGSRSPLRLLGIDPFRAAALQPVLMGSLGEDITRLFAHDALVLSSAAAQSLGLAAGGTLPVVVGGTVKTLRVIDVLPSAAFPDALAIMDIGAAQWTLERIGTLNRIDLQLRPGADGAALRSRLAALLPAGVVAVTPAIERGRTDSATRAYRVNLDMLSLVALLTGALVIFATQSLSVLRRRTALGLLRALGATRMQVRLALLGEAALLGIAGSTLGVLLGALIAHLALRYLGADLGNRQLTAQGAGAALQPGSSAAFLLIGTLVACAGAWLPAREAAARPPALALRAGDAEPVLGALPLRVPGLVLLVCGAVLAWLPPVGGLPLPGYLSIAALLFGALLLVPWLLRVLLGALPRTGAVVLDTGVAQLQGNAAVAALSLASVIASFSLMVSMAIMVHSFRDSFETWLVKLLPADLQLRLQAGGETGAFSQQQQALIAGLAGVARSEFRCVRQVLLRADRGPVALIARELTADGAGQVLPLVRTAVPPWPAGARPAWISEAVQDLYGYQPGTWLELPLATRTQRFYIAGVWRDYARSSGAIVIERADYEALTGDYSATEAAIWQPPHGDTAALAAAIRAQLPAGSALEVYTGPALRERSLLIFDRVFAITYALEAIAVLIGLLGVSVAASATALARRTQFGMLRHVGMLRRQVLAMLAGEGVLLAALAVLYGLLLGAALSVLLVYVINRQSFHWSIDLAVPWWQLGVLATALIAASALTALWSGRAAMSQDAIRAVREDW
ncbi:MAG TPA: FtsX-like permease family protein [Steroidobacteraceae bacterium]|nr:FtsX-like permease family protein [Steroidobacteraceae bacterium]